MICINRTNQILPGVKQPLKSLLNFQSTNKFKKKNKSDKANFTQEKIAHILHKPIESTQKKSKINKICLNTISSSGYAREFDGYIQHAFDQNLVTSK